jgi:hypothetical protein
MNKSDQDDNSQLAAQIVVAVKAIDVTVATKKEQSIIAGKLLVEARQRHPTDEAFAKFLEQGVGIGLRRARFLIAIATGRKDFGQAQDEHAAAQPPKHRVSELAICAGRGAGKDSIASFLAAHTAMSFNPAKAKLRPGENIYVLCLAVDKEQAAICFNMCKGFFETIPTLKAMVKRFGTDTITLTNRVTIKITTNDYKSVRGRGILVAIFDECSFWKTENSATAANPDIEVHAAISPGLARVKGSMLIMISSAYRRTGMLYERWKLFYGKPDDDILVVRGSTTQLNPTFPQATIDRALELDRSRYAAEYLSEWRDDLQSLVSRDVVEACVVPGTYELPPKRDVSSYFAFCDPSSGSGQDSMTLCICHVAYGRETVVIDAIREARPKFSPEQISKEFCALMTSYGISTCISDRFGGEWVCEQFGKYGIRAEQSAKAKSELYLDMLAVLGSGRVELLDHPRAVNQIVSLERRNRSGGRASIDAPVGMHEDIANSIAGAVSISLFKYGSYQLDSMGDGEDNDEGIIAARKSREERLAIYTDWPPRDRDGNPGIINMTNFKPDY